MRSTPAFDPPAGALTTRKHLDAASKRVQGLDTVVARIAAELIERIRSLNATIAELGDELDARTAHAAPNLRSVHGVGPLTAAKIIGETAGIGRFRSRHAYARHNGTAPLPVWSSNTHRHRLSRAGNRQLNAAIHRIALTQASNHPPARRLLDRRTTNGNTKKEAMRVLKRRLSDVVYRALNADAAHLPGLPTPSCLTHRRDGTPPAIPAVLRTPILTRMDLGVERRRFRAPPFMVVALRLARLVSAFHVCHLCTVSSSHQEVRL